MTAPQTVRTQERGGIAEVTIDRPKALNALNEQVLRELLGTVECVAADPALRALVITGAGDKAFVAGADIAGMSDLDAAAATRFGKLGQSVLNAIEAMPVPVIAAVNGFALGGGCELVLACDIVVASEKAKFGQPEVKLGLIPGFGGTVRLWRKIGPGAAAHWIYTGTMLEAREAHRLGLVQEVVAHEAVLERAHAIAKEIAAQSPLAVRAAKAAMVTGYGVAPDVGMRMEAQAFGALFAAEEVREGTRAFLEKRAPNFARVTAAPNDPA